MAASMAMIGVSGLPSRLPWTEERLVAAVDSPGQSGDCVACVGQPFFGSEMHPASWRVQRRPASRIFRRRARRVTGLRRGPPALGLAGPSGCPAGPPGRCGNTSLDAAMEIVFDCIRGPGVPGGLVAPSGGA